MKDKYLKVQQKIIGNEAIK